MYDENVPSSGYMKWGTNFGSWLMGLLHVDSIGWAAWGKQR